MKEKISRKPITLCGNLQDNKVTYVRSTYWENIDKI